ncbi:MAG: porin [Gammaproteobacteria bacterium]|nr:porin [Gammaproteobacteria bacterium]
MRRARLGFSGKVFDFGYKFEADFATAGDSTAATDKGHSKYLSKMLTLATVQNLRVTNLV